MPLGTVVCSTCDIVFSVPFSVSGTLFLSLSILVSLARSLSHSVVLSLSLFLSPSLSCALWWVSLSCFCLSLALLLSCSLANRTSNSLVLPPPPPSPSLSFSLSHATVVALSAQAQMSVISNSILTQARKEAGRTSSGPHRTAENPTAAGKCLELACRHWLNQCVLWSGPRTLKSVRWQLVGESLH